MTTPADRRARDGISIVGVTRRFRRGGGTVVAIDDVSVELTAGELTAVVGPSGAGKTTLLNLVLGEERPDEGRVDGVPDRPTWSDVAIVPQQLGLLAELTVRENIALPIRLGATAARDPDEVMAALGVGDLGGRFPDEISLGQQQRTAIARAVAVDPAIVVVDEPTSHQDEANVEIVADTLADLARSGSLVLVATHDDRLVERCDRVIRLSNGRLVDLVGPSG